MKYRRRRTSDEIPMRVCFREMAKQRESIISFLRDERDMTHERPVVVDRNQSRKRIFPNERRDFVFIFDFESFR